MIKTILLSLSLAFVLGCGGRVVLDCNPDEYDCEMLEDCVKFTYDYYKLNLRIQRESDGSLETRTELCECNLKYTDNMGFQSGPPTVPSVIGCLRGYEGEWRSERREEE